MAVEENSQTVHNEVIGGLQCGLSGNPVLLLATGQWRDERETAELATGSSFQGNPAGPKAVRFTQITTTLLG